MNPRKQQVLSTLIAVAGLVLACRTMLLASPMDPKVQTLACPQFFKVNDAFGDSKVRARSRTDGNGHRRSSGQLLPIRGLWVQFERRGWSSGYWPGEVVQNLNMFDSVVQRTVKLRR